MNTLPKLPTELWNMIYNMKRSMEYEDRWGWRKEIDLSEDVQLFDNGRWWVGDQRWSYEADWPDLDRALFIYYLKYIRDITCTPLPISQPCSVRLRIVQEISSLKGFIRREPNLYNNRFTLLDQIDPSRKESYEGLRWEYDEGYYHED